MEDSDDGGGGWQEKRPRNDSGGEYPAKRFVSRNMYNVLRDESDEQSNNIGTKEKTEEDSPPPIFVPNVKEITGFIAVIRKILSQNEFNYRALHNGEVRLQAKSIEAYRSIVKYFEQRNVQFHSYQLKTDRAFRVIMKGMHHSFPVADIQSELEKHDGVKVRRINKIINRETKQPYQSVFMIELEPTPNVKNVYNVHDIYGALIEIQPPWPRKDIPQCHRCQMYGHTKNFCRRRFVCVKCDGDHPSAECVKPKSVPAKCHWCKGDHTANYRGCPYYQTNILKAPNQTPKEAPNAPANNHANSPPIIHPTYNRGGPSYASMANNIQPQSENNSMMGIIQKLEQSIAKQTELMQSMINMMSSMFALLSKK